MSKALKTIETRFSEVREWTSDLKKMNGKILASPARRTWKEDFIDEDTGEVVSIERHEVVMNKGKLLTGDTLSELNFFIQSGDVKEVEVSNQRRYGMVEEFYGANLFEVTARVSLLKKKYLLHALSVKQAYDIAADWLELHAPEGFRYISDVKAVSEYSYLRLEKKDKEGEDVEQEEEEESSYTEKVFYKASGDIWRMEFEAEEPKRHTYKYILQADDVKEADDVVKQRLQGIIEEIENDGDRVVKFITSSAQPYPVSAIIPRAFCDEYIQRRLQERKENGE